MEKTILMEKIKNGIIYAQKNGINPMEALEKGTEILMDQTKRPAVKLSEGINEFLLESVSRGLRSKTIENYNFLLNKVLSKLGDINIKDCLKEDLINLIKKSYKNEPSRQQLKSAVHCFFNWCSSHERNWCSQNIINNLKWRATLEDKKPIEFLSTEDAENFIRNVPDNLKATVALGLFAGVRTNELMRMKSSQAIDFKDRKIIIRPEWAKTRTLRILYDLPENLWLWLERYPPESDRVVPFDNYSLLVYYYKKTWNNINISPWPRNCLRHSFGTYGFWRGLEWCINTMGHVGGYQTFLRCYKGSSSEEESKKFFSISPQLSLQQYLEPCVLPKGN